MKQVLLTGGLGYIGSHVAAELIEKGLDVVIVDDLSNSEFFVLDRLMKLTGKDIAFEKGDVRDPVFLEKLFTDYAIGSVIHFAAKKAVGESVQKPLLYYDVNVSGLIALLKTVERYPVSKFIFSSSCTVYGNPARFPVTENTPFGTTPSPYGKTKQMCERILQDVANKVPFDIVCLRYFNPVGAHTSANIGELPKGIPNNLVPFITQTAAGLRTELRIFGGDYDTPDGTAVRDYIHVVDLAKAHVMSLEADLGDYMALNIGTGLGHSVLEVVNTFEEVTGHQVPHTIVSRRVGDIPEIYGSAKFANEKLGWKAEKTLSDMLYDSWNWQKSLAET